MKLPEPALESCMSPETWTMSNGENTAQRRRYRQNEQNVRLAGIFPAELCINKGGTAEYSVPDGGWNLRRTTLL